MPLNITHFNPASLAIINRWAQQRETDHNALQKEVQALKGALARLTGGSNPTLANNK